MSEGAPSTESSSAWPLRVMALVLGMLGLVPMAIFLTEDQGVAWWNAAVLQWTIWMLGCAALVIASASFFPKLVGRLLVRGRMLLLAPSRARFALAIGLTACLLSLFFGGYLFGWQPVTGDEFAQSWQASLLTHGRLFAHSETNGEFFSTMMTLDRDGRWFTQFPIGGPALMGLGMALGLPALINPVLTGVATAAVYSFVADISDEISARVTAILFALSPFVLFMGGSQMNHVGTLAALCVALAALPRWRTANTAASAHGMAAVVGASLGMAATIRPYDAALAALAIGIFQLRETIGRRSLWQSLVTQCLVGAVPILLLLAANHATTGHALSFGYDVLNGPEHRPGFHTTPLGIDHTPRRGLFVISSYLMNLDFALLAWPVPALFIVVTVLLLQRRATRWDYLLIGMLAALLAGYAAYWAESYFVGPRFLFSAVPIFLIYVARLPRVLRQRTASPTLRSASLLLIPLWLLVAWLSPAKRSQPHGIWTMTQSIRKPVSAATQIAGTVARMNLRNALVFVPDGWHSRLAARLRAAGTRPLVAERLVNSVDACLLQHALDGLEQLPDSARGRARLALDASTSDASARPIAGLRATDQLALVPDRPLDVVCRHEMESADSHGVSLAELMPDQHLDARGALGGAVIYARDLGERNERLRSRFGDRDWYVVRVGQERGRRTVQLEPYRSMRVGSGL